MTAVRAGHASIAEGALAVAAAFAAAAVFCLRVETGGRPLTVVEAVSPATATAVTATADTSGASAEDSVTVRRRRIGSARYGSWRERQDSAAAAAAEGGGGMVGPLTLGGGNLLARSSTSSSPVIAAASAAAAAPPPPTK